MRLVVGDTVREGRALDADDLPVTPDAAVAAIRETDSNGRTDGLAIEAPDPGPVHEFVGCIRPGMELPLRAALAAAARSRGLCAPQDDRIAALRDRLADCEADAVSTREQRREVAETGADLDRLRERVAELRGRVRALDDAGVDATEARAELSEAARRLSEAETERVAATERLDRARTAARERRDARERRLRLEDRLANREREARAHLVERAESDYTAALEAVPAAGSHEPPVTDPFDAPPVTAALAVARVAELDAPLVLACDRFSTPERAADWLAAPVLSL